jgi:hypothetical protein
MQTFSEPAAGVHSLHVHRSHEPLTPEWCDFIQNTSKASSITRLNLAPIVGANPGPEWTAQPLLMVGNLVLFWLALRQGLGGKVVTDNYAA